MFDRTKRVPARSATRALARLLVGPPTFDYRQAASAGWTVERYRFGRRIEMAGPAQASEHASAPVTY